MVAFIHFFNTGQSCRRLASNDRIPYQNSLLVCPSFKNTITFFNFDVSASSSTFFSLTKQAEAKNRQQMLSRNIFYKHHKKVLVFCFQLSQKKRILSDLSENDTSGSFSIKRITLRFDQLLIFDPTPIFILGSPFGFNQALGPLRFAMFTAGISMTGLILSGF